jgi:mono/diheme cytochrome c family protein
MIPKALSDKLLNLYPRWSPRMFKATIVALFAAALVIPLALSAVPFIEFFNGMAAQPKGKAQMTYGRIFGEELLVERLPVEGTIPRGYEPYRFADRPATIAAAKEVGGLLANPLPRTIENMRAGQDNYNVYCNVCHGKQGMGDGPIIGPNRFPAPPSLHTDQARNYEDGTIFHIVTNGTEKMPSYADKLDPDERWQVIHYLRALQRAMNPEPEDLEP